MHPRRPLGGAAWRIDVGFGFQCEDSGVTDRRMSRCLRLPCDAAMRHDPGQDRAIASARVVV